MNVYIAGPVVADKDTKLKIDYVHERLKLYKKHSQVPVNIFRPGEHHVPNEWGITMEMWGQCVFTMDVLALDQCDWVVLCNFGRQGQTAGTAWECGYAFSKGKQILVVNMPDVKESSLMINGCAANQIDFKTFLEATDLYLWESVFVERGKLPAKQVLN